MCNLISEKWEGVGEEEGVGFLPLMSNLLKMDLQV